MKELRTADGRRQGGKAGKGKAEDESCTGLADAPPAKRIDMNHGDKKVKVIKKPVERAPVTEEKAQDDLKATLESSIGLSGRAGHYVFPVTPSEPFTRSIGCSLKFQRRQQSRSEGSVRYPRAQST
jgi:hypothetical protein